jgi:hypothetical protein
MGHADRSVTDRHYVGDFPMEYQRRSIALLEQPAQVLTGSLGAIWEPNVIQGRRDSVTRATAGR